MPGPVGRCTVTRVTLRRRLGSASPGRRSYLIDGALAGGVVVAGVLDLGGRDPRGLWLAGIVLTGGVLLARSRAPLGVLIGVLALTGALTPATTEEDPPYQWFAMMIAAFGVGAHRERRRALAGIAILLAFQLTRELARGAPTPDAILGPAILYVVWGFGFVYRTMRGRQTNLETETARLRQERDERARAAVADERARMARELHDAVAHSVSMMVMQVGAVRRRIGTEQERERGALEDVEQAGREAVTELRQLVGILRQGEEDEARMPRPGLARVGELVERMRGAGLAVELEVRGEAQTLPAGVDLAAYRIVQESLTNVLKHAAGARARVEIAHRPAEVRLAIVDDGAGGTRGGEGNGHGLVGMRERVGLYGGELHAGPRAEGGFEVRARLPLPREVS